MVEEKKDDLTVAEQEAFAFVCDNSNEITKEGNKDIWKENVLKNRIHFSKGNPDLTGLSVFILAAGPSLEKNIKELKEMSERGVIICLDAAYRFVLSQGIKPDMMMMIDGSEKIGEMIKGCETKETTLICTPSSSPDVVTAWEGPKFFVTTPSAGVEREHNTAHLTRIVKAQKDIKSGDEIIADVDYKVEFEGVNLQILTGGNVSTAAHSFALRALKAQQIIMLGCDLSWTHESHHYAGHEHAENTKLRAAHVAGEYMTHKDLNKVDVNTNFGLFAFKRWHEQVARTAPGSLINATEGGILGVDREGEKYKFVEFLTAKEAVAKYCPHIRRFFPILNGVIEPIKA